MAQAFPYTYYACNCFDSNTSGKRAAAVLQEAADEDEGTFDPRSPRANYQLYPLEHLLYCEDCQQIRCPRCQIEETLNWYCPSCLFEVPSSVVKSDGNRCNRSCFSCPLCTSPMQTFSLDPTGESGPPFILECQYCRWSTVEIGIEFEKGQGISAQLARIGNGGKPLPSHKERDKERERRKELEARKRDGRELFSPSTETTHTDKDEGPPSHDDLFASLSAFYKSQVESQTSASPFSSHDINFSSPSAYSRIMNLYSTSGPKKKQRPKPTAMREAASALEGLTLHDPSADTAAIERLKRDGWASTISPAQKRAQPNPSVRFTSDLRPLATLLCTKRSKRCRSCRQILTKPEAKITSTRYKIKLLALNHIPRLSIRALASDTPVPGSSRPPAKVFDYNALKPGIPTHFLFHMSNPLFDPIKVTLATPSTTPGKVQSRVTILCPQFDVGANTDIWDDALNMPAKRGSLLSDQAPQIEAGKIWDRGRNWTSVAVEIVPGFLDESARVEAETPGRGGPLEEDDDVLEIPVFVRIEYEADTGADERGLVDSKGGKGEKEKREEAFWTVVGVGRIKGS
ncbi:dynactin-like protein Arp1 p62 subunit RO2 [Bimuria novae-zelandiae CBS 107.79]|uniref:Dynactin subunit 4 n=1 Tax=Bimuria novae-zelandiae CBS 107.79 TaxID=1447943 RepID=A0A6A5VQA8_9PLEO|nr:dynactin-like protein Arp1 p62 subunit RO2 [Bimuria novae-zelandiae CBS 107.79]